MHPSQRLGGRWQGRGPAYDIYYRANEAEDWTRLNDQAVAGTSYPLMGLAPGRYLFRIVTVDPASPMPADRRWPLAAVRRVL